MRHRFAVAHRLALEGVAHGVPQVERFAQTSLGGVLLHNALLHLQRSGQEFEQLVVINIMKVEMQQPREMVVRVEHRVLEHLGKARLELLSRQSREKAGAHNHLLSRRKHPYLVFQAVEIHPRLATHSGVDSRQQRGGNVDEMDAALESGSGETAQVGHHSPTQVHQQRVASSLAVFHSAPHGSERGSALILVASGKLNDPGITQTRQLRQRHQPGVAVDEHHHTIVIATLNNRLEGGIYLVSINQFLRHCCTSVIVAA